MTEIEKWVEGKQPALAATAILWASMVDSIYDLFIQLKDRKTLGQRFEISDFDSWFSLYQSGNKVTGVVVPLLSLKLTGTAAPIDFGNKIEFIGRTMTGTMNNNIPKQQDFTNPDESNKLFQEMLSVTLKELKQKRSEKPIDITNTTMIKDFIDANKMEIYFFVLVLFTCLMLYQTVPGLL